MEYILDNSSFEYEKMGGKASAFARLSKNNYNIPEWFVISADLLIDNIEFNDSLDLDILKQKIEAFNFINYKDKIKGYLKEGEMYAVRSSARAEDSSENSFAGQFDSFLNIKKADVLEYIIKVWLSGLNGRVLEYIKNKDIRLKDIIPSVLIQRQIKSECAGVAFAVNPINGNTHECVVAGVFGLGSSLVGGDVSADNYIFNKDSKVITFEVAKKDIAEICSEDGVKVLNLTKEKSEERVLTDEQVEEISRLCISTSEFFGRFQDIEWAIEDNKLYLLQSRPITTLKNIINDSGNINVWDNSNIAESYGGVTTPLTYSFIKKAYGEVYKQMCKMFDVREEVLGHNEYTFEHMLGNINGRVYYNMISWYKLISMLPGYSFNKTFMMQMMGAKEPLPEDAFRIVDNNMLPSTKVKDSMQVVRGVRAIIKNLNRIDKLVEEFYFNVKDAIGEKDVKNMTLAELGEYYRELEKRLIVKWDAPIINDFFAMIFYGLLRGVSEKDADGKLKEIYNDLLCGEGDIISTQPAKKIKFIADKIKDNEEAIELLCLGEKELVKKKLNEYKELNCLINEYIDAFGDRCLDELKLETETLADNPINLYRAIGFMAKKLKNGDNVEVDEKDIRLNAEKTYKRVLRFHPLKKVKYRYILNKARKFVRNRENLRFERTRVFGTVRKIFVQVGIRLASLGVIEDAKDIFYLELNEILGYIEGNTTTKSFGELVKIRKREYEKYRVDNVPDDRFNTYGAVGINNSYKCEVKRGIEEKIDGEKMMGLGCCPGIVRGRVRVVTNPAGVEMEEGEILVAERTDPGWIMLFPASKGVLVERGSLLSHAAIVVREMGIPAVVGIENLTKWLVTGDIVELNGATGEVVKIN